MTNAGIELLGQPKITSKHTGIKNFNFTKESICPELSACLGPIPNSCNVFEISVRSLTQFLNVLVVP